MSGTEVMKRLRVSEGENESSAITTINSDIPATIKNNIFLLFLAIT